MSLLNIPHESLAHLLAAVRTHHSPPLSTHIPSLKPLLPGDVIEVQGPPASGKTHFLYYLIINSLLPATLDGWDSIAAILDTEMTFDISRFHQLLLARLNRLLPRADHDVAQNLAQDALNRLHIFQPDSSSQLAVTIYNLPKYMADKFPDRHIGLVAIDSISAFYWPDRYTAQQLQIAGEGSNKSFTHPFSYVLSALRSLHLHCSPVIILTNWGLIPDPELTKSNSGLVPMFKQHLHPYPGPFTQSYPATAFNTPVDPFITRHITLSLAPFPPSAPGTEPEAGKTASAHHQGKIIGIVRYLGSSDDSTFTLAVKGNDMTVL